MPLNLSDHQIERLIAGKTVPVRVKKKEGESQFKDCVVRNMDSRKRIVDGEPIWMITNPKTNKVDMGWRRKFTVGKDYAVHSKGKAVWWCPFCYKNIETLEQGVVLSKQKAKKHNKANSNYSSKPLRTRITEITQEEDMKEVYGDWEYCGDVWCLKCKAKQ